MVLVKDQKKMWTKKTASKHLRDNWSNVKSQVGFLGINKLWGYYKGVLSKASIEKILTWVLKGPKPEEKKAKKLL